MIRILISFAGGFALALLAIWFWDAYHVQETIVPAAGDMIEQSVSAESTADKGAETISATDTAVGTSTTVQSTTTDIGVSAQPAGSSVLVTHANIPESGWIVVHELFDGVVANALGAVRRDAGTYDELSVPLLRDTAAGNDYAVVLYRDDGDKVFDIQKDHPMSSVSGSLLFTTFTAQ